MRKRGRKTGRGRYPGIWIFDKYALSHDDVARTKSSTYSTNFPEREREAWTKSVCEREKERAWIFDKYAMSHDDDMPAWTNINTLKLFSPNFPNFRSTTEIKFDRVEDINKLAIKQRHRDTHIKINLEKRDKLQHNNLFINHNRMRNIYGIIWVRGSGSRGIKWREKESLTNKDFFLRRKLYLFEMFFLVRANL